MTDLASIYREHYGYVLHLCQRIMQSPADAEDMAQTVFCHLASVPQGKTAPRWMQFEGRSGLRTWLHTVTRRVCLLELRSRRKKPLPLSFDVPVEGEEAAAEFHATEPGGPWVDPDGRLILGQGLAELPPGYRAALVLRYYWGMDHREAARAMGWSVGCSKSQSYRGIRSLRRYLG